jgi:GNAT superfamily N-acetyltransferase
VRGTSRTIVTADKFNVSMKPMIAPCGSADLPVILEIINDSARAYKGVIPADRWHEPYMAMTELISEIDKGVRFYGYYSDDRLKGVMGIQDIKDVTLIRHAYVRSECRGQSIGGELLTHLNQLSGRPVLIGTWKAATWAIRFYEKNGFVLLGNNEKNRLLISYWTIPNRQIEESIVLADKRWRNHANQSTDPTFSSNTPGAGHQSRHP